MTKPYSITFSLRALCFFKQAIFFFQKLKNGIIPAGNHLMGRAMKANQNEISMDLNLKCLDENDLKIAQVEIECQLHSEWSNKEPMSSSGNR